METKKLSLTTKLLCCLGFGLAYSCFYMVMTTLGVSSTFLMLLATGLGVSAGLYLKKK